MSNRHFHRRLQSIEMEPMDDSSDNSNQTWLQDGINSMQIKRSEMNALIMDYLVHEGFKEAAERFKEEAGIGTIDLIFDDNTCDTVDKQRQQQHNQNNQQHCETSNSINNNNTNNNKINTDDVGRNNGRRGSSQSEIMKEDSPPPNDDDRTTNSSNIDWLTKAETPEMMDRRIEIRHLIEEGDVLKGQSLINLYYPELLDDHRNLYFKLQQQHLIELIRQQKISEVLAYVHNQLSVDEQRDLTEMERTLALLAYENPDKSPYAGLLHTSRRYKLASSVNDVILKETTGDVETKKPRLVTLLKLLYWTQSELERKKIQFPKMTDLVNGTIEPKH